MEELEIRELLGKTCYPIWKELVEWIQEKYEPQWVWGKGGKRFAYELKIRKNSRTICSLFPEQDKFSFMVILGQKEREAFEQIQEKFQNAICEIYETTKTYHDGKWLLFEIRDKTYLSDCRTLLQIKRKPK